MDKRAEIIDRLIKEQGFSKKSFAESIGIPPTTLRSMLERGIGKASVDNVIKVCKGLGITVDELDVMVKRENNDLPELNDKDEKDIQKELKRMIEDLKDGGSYAAFDGSTYEEMDTEDRELLVSSLENTLRVAKRMAKQKFTPKKYKDQE